MAISTNDADKLSGLLKREPGAELFLQMVNIEQPEVVSYNVIGEIRGTEHPEEIIAFGGHLDAWDIADMRHALRLDPHVKLLSCVATNKESVKSILLELLYSILAEMEGGAG